jgi:hypothetical protein
MRNLESRCERQENFAYQPDGDFFNIATTAGKRLV